jgi:hypothetical protein
MVAGGSASIFGCGSACFIFAAGLKTTFCDGRHITGQPKRIKNG